MKNTKRACKKQLGKKSKIYDGSEVQPKGKEVAELFKGCFINLFTLGWTL